MIRSVAAIANTPSANVSSRVVGTAFSLPGMADAAIKTVWLDNPPLNVIGSEIAEMLARALGEIDDETCVVVLRGKGDRAFSAGADERMVRGISHAFLPGTPIYGTSTLVALWSPIASVILFALIAGFYVLESSLFAKAPTRVELV